MDVTWQDPTAFPNRMVDSSNFDVRFLTQIKQWLKPLSSSARACDGRPTVNGTLYSGTDFTFTVYFIPYDST